MAKATNRKNESVRLNIEKADKWLKKHWQGKKLCSVCNNSAWHIIDEVVEIRAYNEGRTTIGGSIFPHLAVVCVRCGNTLFFNALLSGLVEQPE